MDKARSLPGRDLSLVAKIVRKMGNSKAAWQGLRQGSARALGAQRGSLGSGCADKGALPAPIHAKSLLIGQWHSPKLMQ